MTCVTIKTTRLTAVCTNETNNENVYDMQQHTTTTTTESKVPDFEQEDTESGGLKV